MTLCDVTSSTSSEKENYQVIKNPYTYNNKICNIVLVVALFGLSIMYLHLQVNLNFQNFLNIRQYLLAVLRISRK